MSRVFRSRPFQIVVSLGLAAGFTWFFLRRVDFRELGHAIAGASPAWMLTSLALGVGTFLIRALRWQWILEPVGRVPFMPAFRATAIGFAANTVLPARAGEVLRPALLSRERGLPFSALLASIAFERVLDGLSQLLFLAIAIVKGPPAGSPAETAALSSSPALRLAAGALCAAIVLLVLFAVVWRKTTERIFDRGLRVFPERWRPRLRGIGHTFLDGFASLKSPRLLALVAGGSLAMWFVINLQIYAVMRAFHLPLPVTAAFVVTTAAVLGVAVPTPGGIGSYQAAVQYALTRFYGVAPAPASGVAILAWASSFVLITLLGFALFASAPGRRQALAQPERPGNGKRETGTEKRAT
jgi:uncharacterized protein (TIRG00374 family)